MNKWDRLAGDSWILFLAPLHFSVQFFYFVFSYLNLYDSINILGFLELVYFVLITTSDVFFKPLIQFIDPVHSW